MMSNTKEKKELVGVCGMKLIYKWLPSIEKGEQIVGGSKLEDGKIIPPKKKEKGWPFVLFIFC